MFVILDQLNEMQFTEMEELEKRFYSSEYITPAKESYHYYMRFPLSTIAASDEGRIVGFINLFPVVDEVYKSLLNGTYNDSNLTFLDIAEIDRSSTDRLHMFLSCIVVDNAYRKQGVTRALLKAAVERYSVVKHRCDYIVTDNVTQDGCRFSMGLGFKFVCKTDHESSVFIMLYDEFVKAIA